MFERGISKDTQKYLALLTNYNEIHLVKSLTYFEDAEDDKMPTMHERIDWNTVKGFFVKQVQKLF